MNGPIMRTVPPPLRWIKTSELIAAALYKLAPKLPPDISAVCGISRSGLCPAAALASWLSVPLYSINQHEGPPILLGHGMRGVSSRTGKTLIVDDTMHKGVALGNVRRRLGNQEFLYAAVYVNPPKASEADFFGELLAMPHLLEWNLFNGCSDGVLTDMDGILCEDADPPLTDSQFAEYIPHARPLMLPRRTPVAKIVTARLEKWRAETTAWLDRWGVKYGELVMAPDRRNSGMYKADVYIQAQQSLFIESDPGQAEQIYQITRKPVICPAIGRIFQ